jgi:hypothetical protein
LLDRVCELVPDSHQLVGATASGEEHLATDRRGLRATCKSFIVMDRDAARSLAERSRRAEIEGCRLAPMFAHGILAERRCPSEQERQGWSWVGCQLLDRLVCWRRHLQRRHRRSDLVDGW